MAEARENYLSLKSDCPKCEKKGNWQRCMVGEDERVYLYNLCRHCGFIHPERVRVYWGFGEKGGRTHIDHEQLGKVELAQL